MKSKRILKFYFSADKLNGALDALIMAHACKFSGGGEKYAEKIIKIIEAKRELSELWNYLDGVIGKLSESERRTLEFYGNLRVGIRRLGGDRVREIKRATIKFRRHASRLEKFNPALKLADEYFCLY